MVEIDITKMSSKGQIVIPAEIRKYFSKGEKFIIMKEGNLIILKSTRNMDKNFEEDLEFAKRTEEAFRKYERGEFKEVDDKKFLEMLEEW
ncbi:MAG TPA: AbrB/MazE/SpoVT family DNA-binding domain-containing protein [Thermoplasmatales archaeon]|nr:AbrB/MazE/SpoVT family DNA-binding domain-containing protein [Thermoplasmatales archaeon]